jgi:hypothetical protein
MDRRLLLYVGAPALLGVLAATQVRAQSREDHLADDFCSEESSPILVLGTYHMANPGLDSYNVEADDVLSPRRQQEIGFRLGRRLGPANIEPVDFPMWMNGWRNDEIDWDKLAERRAAQEAENDTAANEPSPSTEEQRRLLESSITDYLRWLNSPDEIRDGHAVYMRLTVKINR